MVSAVTDRSMIPMCSFRWTSNFNFGYNYNEILDETLQRIRRDFNHISGVFSINCVFRYLLFSQEHHMEDYLKTMSTLGDHAGLIGFGEHYNQQFVNQTMTCVVFE